MSCEDHYKRILGGLKSKAIKWFNRLPLRLPAKDDTVSGRIKVQDGGYYGDYHSWDAAQCDSAGYDDALIIDKVRNAMLKVKTGEAVYERDSVLFSEIQYSWPLLACLMRVASLNSGNLNVLDFGGSLGSTYYQNRIFLKGLSSVRWSVVEQPKFCEYGRCVFQTDELRFYHDFDQCVSEQKPNLIVLSSVLPYVKEPYELLERVSKSATKYVVIDRNPFIDGPDDRLTVQVVPRRIYEASYPAWFFSKEKFMNAVRTNYRVIAEFNGSDARVYLEDKTATFRGMFLERM